MPASDALKAAVTDLRSVTGLDWRLSEEPVPGTSLHVVYVEGHEMPARYDNSTATLGFRVPATFPDAGPEDAFFLAPATLRLREDEPARGSKDINRAGAAAGHCNGVLAGNPTCLVFSWHLWDRVPWDRRKNTLIDHYTHCLRRFDQPEHG